MSNTQVQIFESKDGKAQLKVSLQQNTVWLSQAQMSELFDTTPENVLMHLKNIFKEQELTESATTKEFLVVRQEYQAPSSPPHKTYPIWMPLSLSVIG